MSVAVFGFPLSLPCTDQETLIVGILEAVQVDPDDGIVMDLGFPSLVGPLHSARLAIMAREVRGLALDATTVACARVGTLWHFPVILVVMKMPAFETAVPHAAKAEFGASAQ